MSVNDKVIMAAVSEGIGHEMLVHHHDLPLVQRKDIRLIADPAFRPLLKEEFVAVVVSKDPDIGTFEFLEKFQRKGRRIIPGMNYMLNLCCIEQINGFFHIDQIIVGVR
jgi:hypothetical protein